jgi:uncharacterized membrane protein
MRNFLFSVWENLIYVLVGILVVNILVLDYFTFLTGPKNIVQNIQLGNNSAPSSDSAQEASQNTGTDSAGKRIQTTDSASNSCPAACQTAIKNAIASITPVVVTTAPAQQTTSSGGAQEFFVPFGAASGASQGTYATLPALQAYVNMSQYSGVQTVTFEVSMTIPNGNQTAYVQLYNSTDGYAIPNSQMTMSGGTPQLLISPNLTLPAGNKLYQVQINTQLNSSINIDQARLHITTN